MLLVFVTDILSISSRIYIVMSCKLVVIIISIVKIKLNRIIVLNSDILFLNIVKVFCFVIYIVSM